jgi:sarcosine oxidase
VSGAYDVAVVGLGAMGAAAAWHLARRGARVVGLDAHAPGHELGSSHGSSRITREAYPDELGYVPLVRRAMDQWDAIGGEVGQAVLHRVGAIAIAPASEQRILGGIASAAAFGIPLERLTRADVVERFPGFTPPPDAVAVYEPGAGYLAPEAGVAALRRLATGAGARLRFSEPVVHWQADGDGVVIATVLETLRAERLVLAVGAWAPELLGDIGVPLQAQRRINVHFEPRIPERFSIGALPVFNLVVPEGQYYGFPLMPGAGVKLGRHDGDAPCTPRTIDRVVTDAEAAEMRAVLDAYLPGSAGVELRRVTCLYTMSPDGHFVLDHHPGLPQVALFAGCSGHAFKFAPVVGEVLADLALDGRTDLDVGFLSAGRFAGVAA